MDICWYNLLAKPMQMGQVDYSMAEVHGNLFVTAMVICVFGGKQE